MSIGSVGSIQGTANAFELQASRAKDRLRSRGVPDVVVNPGEGRAEKLGTPSPTGPAAATYRPWQTYPAPAPELLGKPSAAITGDPERLGAPWSASTAEPRRLGAPASAPAPAPAPAPDALGGPTVAFERDARLLGAPTQVAPPAPDDLGAPDAQIAPAPERLGAPTGDVAPGVTRRLGGPVAFTPDVPVR